MRGAFEGCPAVGELPTTYSSVRTTLSVISLTCCFIVSLGYLNPEACIEAYLLMATKHGAELHHNEAMISYTFVESSSSSEKSLQSDCGVCYNTSSSDSPVCIHNTHRNTNDNSASDVITVVTTKGTYKTHKLVLTVGAWAPEIYGNALPFELFLERRVLFWFKPTFVEGENYQVSLCVHVGLCAYVMSRFCVINMCHKQC